MDTKQQHNEIGFNFIEFEGEWALAVFNPFAQRIAYMCDVYMLNAQCSSTL